jgi:hypothetical protein
MKGVNPHDEIRGSNPSPGAYFEEPSISLKALAGESRVVEVRTTMDGLTANTTEQKQTMTTAANTSSNSRLQPPYSSIPRKRDETIAANSSIEIVTPSLNSATVSTSLQLDEVIDSITQGMSRKAMNTRLKMLYRISPSNAATIYEHILSEQTERNIKTSTSENKVKALLWLTRFLKLKPFEQMTKQDILSYLNGLRKPKEEDPQQKWIVPYNNRLRVYKVLQMAL